MEGRERSVIRIHISVLDVLGRINRCPSELKFQVGLFLTNETLIIVCTGVSIGRGGCQGEVCGSSDKNQLFDHRRHISGRICWGSLDSRVS